MSAMQSYVLRPTRMIGATFLVACLLILVTACGENMRDQARCDPYEANAFFDDGTCARQPPLNTIAHGSAENELELAGSGIDGQPVEDFPFPITRQVLSVGRDRYDGFCAPCHGISGYGNGMIVQRGFPAPPSFHTQRLRDVPPGYIVDVIANGFGRMFSYGDRVTPEERWAITAYIRALQLSQNATAADIPAEERSQLIEGTQ